MTSRSGTALSATPTAPRTKFISLARELGPGGGFAALGAALPRRRLPWRYRYSVRAASRAAEAQDPDRCTAALAAAVIAMWDQADDRELMINLTPHHVAATRVCGSAAALFDWAADGAAAHQAETLRAFGRRTDVTLEAFGSTEVDRPTGTWFVYRQG